MLIAMVSYINDFIWLTSRCYKFVRRNNFCMWARTRTVQKIYTEYEDQILKSHWDVFSVQVKLVLKFHWQQIWTKSI